MKIAIPIWNGYVSSVFDFAHRLLLLEIQNGSLDGRLKSKKKVKAVRVLLVFGENEFL